MTRKPDTKTAMYQLLDVIREHIHLGHVRLQWVDTTQQRADIFTKAADKGTFVKMRNVMMNASQHLIPGLEAAMLTLHGSSRRLADKLRAAIGLN